MPSLVLRWVRNGVRRWTRPEQVPTPEADAKRHQQVLNKHAKDFDWIAERARKRGHDLDEAEFAQAKADHLHLVQHVLSHGDRDMEKHLRKLKIYPWDGQNETGYHPVHHAIFIGSEAMAGGHKRYGVSLSRMVTHETAHALDHRDGESRAGSEIHAKLSRTDKSLNWLPDRLKGAVDDHREWGPRLLELHHEDPKAFNRAALRLYKGHGVDVHDIIKRQMGVRVQDLTT